MKNSFLPIVILLSIILYGACKSSYNYTTVREEITTPRGNNEIWLSHEHILVDFTGADRITRDDYSESRVIETMLPYLLTLKGWNVSYFVDATPSYLGRNPSLLKELSVRSGLKIMTNTGFYGARENKYVPEFAFDRSAEEIAGLWIDEFENGIEGTGIKPGFIKISVDAAQSLHPIHQKIVKAAALTHLKTGMTIASHTGKAEGLWPQLEILKSEGVSPRAFIWVHAQNENDVNAYKKAAEEGCWISLDGMGWNTTPYIEKLRWAKENGLLGNILISHDAGWFDPQKSKQEITPYTNIFKAIIPKLEKSGFTNADFDILLRKNPSRAFHIEVRKSSKE